jgi:glycosyltransferase involved in cell wall biosynthesis
MGRTKVKLSVCTIVKNDELLIQKMLDSVVGAVDEVVIADTGSTDKTVDVIHHFMDAHPGLVKLLHFEWCNDFSAARNYTIEQSTGDWILVLDADEYLDAQEKLRLRAFLETCTHGGVFVTQRNYTGTMRNLSSVIDVDVVRVFRRQYRYEGSIHEQIAGNIDKNGGTLTNFKLHLHHVGYTEEYMKLKGKSSRNQTMLEDQLKSTGKRDKIERWFTASNLLAEYSSLGQWEKVASNARVLIEEIKRERRKNFPNFLPRIYKFCINGLRNTQKFDDALRICNEAIRYFPKHTDLQLMKAEVHMNRSEFTEALDVLQVCRNLGDVKFDLSEYIEGTGTYTAARAMATCWMRLGDVLNARHWFVTSFKENTEQIGLIPWLVLLTHEHEILTAMEKVLQTPQRYDEFIQYYAFAGYDDAMLYIEKAEEQWGVHESTERARFAYEIRHHQKPTTENPLWLGLYEYEQGNDAKAIEYWSIADGRGGYLKTVCERTTALIKWEVKNIFLDLLAAKSVRFLSDFGHYISDLNEYFPLFMNTDLLAGFASEDFIRMKATSHEVVEWKAQLVLSQGDTLQASRLIERALLPSGKKSVRGYLIEADLKKEASRQIVSEARSVYADSLMLQHVWYENFVPATVLH